jgi:hypothetical protein
LPRRRRAYPCGAMPTKAATATLSITEAQCQPTVPVPRSTLRAATPSRLYRGLRPERLATAGKSVCQLGTGLTQTANLFYESRWLASRIIHMDLRAFKGQANSRPFSLSGNRAGPSHGGCPRRTASHRRCLHPGNGTDASCRHDPRWRHDTHKCIIGTRRMKLHPRAS